MEQFHIAAHHREAQHRRGGYQPAPLVRPARLAIVARLAEGDATVKELAEPFSMSLPAISRHLKVLERAGLIARGRSAQSRPSSLRVEALREAATWMTARRELWEGRIDRLDGHLKTIQEDARS